MEIVKYSPLEQFNIYPFYFTYKELRYNWGWYVIEGYFSNFSLNLEIDRTLFINILPLYILICIWTKLFLNNVLSISKFKLKFEKYPSITYHPQLYLNSLYVK